MCSTVKIKNSNLIQICFYLAVLACTVLACKADKVKPSLSELLINEKGWDTYEYKRNAIGTVEPFDDDKPYLIFQQYGSGCKFKSNGKLFTNYTTNGPEIIETGPIGHWETTSENEILVYFDEDSTHVQIVEVSKVHLWLKYEINAHSYSYKLIQL